MTLKELKQIIAEGEGYKIEFKEAVSNLDKDLVAFANASGGRVFIGVGDSGEIVGVKNANRLKAEIESIAFNCDPPIKIHSALFRNIIIVTVLEGKDKPYKCKTGFYTRNGTTSQKLKRDQIIELCASEGKMRYDELLNEKFVFSKHFDRKKFETFLSLAGIERILEDAILLSNLGVATRHKAKLSFNNAGILLFAKKLSDIYYHTTVTCALYQGADKVDVLDRKDFNDDLLSSINDTMIFLKKYIGVKYHMTGSPQRTEIPEIPFDALREAIINAVVHRDYFEKGANVMVEVFADRVEVSNPGGLVKGLNPEDFGKKSILRNPLLAGLLHRIKYIEKMGTGISRMQKLMKQAGLPRVEFAFGTFFTAVFKKTVVPVSREKIHAKSNSKGGEKGGEKVGEKVTDNQLKILQAIKRDPHISAKALAKIVTISSRKIEENIAKLKSKNLLRRIGPAKGGYWEVDDSFSE